MSRNLLLVAACFALLFAGCERGGEPLAVDDPDTGSSSSGGSSSGGPPGGGGSGPQPGPGGQMSGSITIAGQDPGALSTVALAALEAGDPVELIVLWRADVTAADRTRTVQTYDLPRHSAQLGAFQSFCYEEAEAVRQMKRRLMADARVAQVFVVPMVQTCYTPDDDLWSKQWDKELMNMEDAWDQTRGSVAVTVAVIDTGIDPQHPEFTGRLVAGWDAISDASRSMDGNGRDDDPDDAEAASLGDISHGTHVSGIIAANDDGAGTVGVDHQCKIMPVRALTGSMGGSTLDIWAALIYAASVPDRQLQEYAWYREIYPNGTADIKRASEAADVINMSLGGTADPFQDALILEIEHDLMAMCAQNGTLVVVAAGNDRGDGDHPTLGRTVAGKGVISPAAMQHVITVGSVAPSKAYAVYSSYGVELDVCAPGGAMGPTDGDDQVWAPNYGTDADGDPAYTGIRGTSMACPQVAGLAALIKARSPRASVDQLRQILIDNVEDLGTADHDPDYGYGLVLGDEIVAGATAAIRNELRFVESYVRIPHGNDQGTFTLWNPAGSVNALGTIDYEVEYLESDANDWVRQVTFDQDVGTVTIDASGMGIGVFTAFLRLEAGSQEAVITIVAQNADAPDPGDIEEVQVLLINTETQVTKNQVLTMPASDWSFGGLNAGTYTVVAGTDFNGNGSIDDEGEYFGQSGAYPVTASEGWTNIIVDLLPVIGGDG